MSRRAWSDELCRRLHAHVSRETPPGLGGWEPAWKLVESPSKALLEMLAEYEESGAREARLRCIELAGEVLTAWRAATMEWERAGKPITRETITTG